MGYADKVQSSAFETEPYQYREIDGLRIAYRDCGQGPVLLMLHGWPLHGVTFAPLADALSGGYRCIVPDLPGAGASRWSNSHDLSPAGQAELMQKLMSALGITQYSVLGNDSGGIVARYLALNEKDRVKKLVLLNTEIPRHRAPYQRMYKFLARWLPGYNAMASMQLRFDGYLASRRGFGGTLYDHSHLLGAFRQRYIAPLTRSRASMEEARCSFIAVLNWGQLDRLHDLHPEIAAQTLLIWGRQDPTFPEPLARRMSEGFRRLAGFVSIDRARLYVHEDRPEEVIPHLQAFLRGG